MTDEHPHSSVGFPDILADAFPNSRPSTRATLAQAARVQRFGSGQTVVRQDDPSSVGLILEGHVAARRVTAAGRQLIVRIAGQGELEPLLPLATRRAAADGIALGQSVAAVWRSEDIRTLAMSDPGFAVDLLDHALGSLDELIEQVDDLVYRGTLRRVARVLHLKADLFFGERPVLTRAHLPILVGASREMTDRILRLFERRRIIARLSANRLKLLDPAGLAIAADAAKAGWPGPAPRPAERSNGSH
jgi:CRP-like cAMP-binding protein